MSEKRLFVIAALAAAAAVAAPAAAPATRSETAPDRAAFAACHARLDRCAPADSAAAIAELLELHQRALSGDLALLEGAAASMPPRARFGYANILLRLGRAREALVLYDGLVAERPAWACPWHKKGLAHRRLGQHDACVAAYRRAIELKPSDAGTRVALARVECETGDFAGALETLRGGLSCAGVDLDDPGRRSVQPDIEFLCLRILRGCGRREAAAAQLERCRRLAPDDPRLAGAETATPAR